MSAVAGPDRARLAWRAPATFPVFSARLARVVWAAFLLVVPGLRAQGVVHLPSPHDGGVAVQERAFAPDQVIDLPAVPKAVLRATNPVWQRVPAGGPGLPLPDSPETVAMPAPDRGLLTAPGDFRFFLNRPVQATGLNSSALGEPSVGSHRDTVMYTGNTYAALSNDSGRTWTFVNPSTLFPAADGGVCCDQRLLHVPTHDMTVWLIEYRVSTTTQRGRHRIALARGRDDVRNRNWTFFDLDPQRFGFGNNLALDFGSIAVSATELYGSALVINTNPAVVGTVLWRVNLDDLRNNVPTPVIFYTNTDLGGFGGYRFAQGAGADMFWAAHTDTSTLRVYRWNAGNCCAGFADRSVSTWNGTATPAPGPDGRDWTGFAFTVNCVLDGWANGSETGFLWTSGSVSGRPQQFVRMARFRTSDLSLIDQRDVFNNDFAFHFPSCSANSRGHVGVTLCFGGGTFAPSVGCFIIDDFVSWSGLTTFFIMSQGTAGPTSNRWGDYFSTGRHSVSDTTWVGAGHVLNGTTVEPRFAWFGRERDEPVWSSLAVSTTSPSAIAITVDRSDLDGLQNGTTPFTRRYAPRQSLTLTAPVLNGNGTFVFDRWALDNLVQPLDQRSVTIADIAAGARTVQARYVAAAEMDIESSPTGAFITVTPNDASGLGSGVTPFRRHYRPGVAMTLTAPATFAGRPFARWLVQGNPRTPLLRTLNINSADGHYLAEYGVHSNGSFRSFGTGCSGRGGNLGQQASATVVPDIGSRPLYTVFNAFPLGTALMFEGFSSTSWGGIPLPATIPGTTCTIYTDLTIAYPAVAVNLAGLASTTVFIPNDVNLIGGRYYTQWLGIDGTTTLGFTLSNAIETTIGGTR